MYTHFTIVHVEHAAYSYLRRFSIASIEHYQTHIFVFCNLQAQNLRCEQITVRKFTLSLALVYVNFCFALVSLVLCITKNI
jgi:hypothetical protein